MKKEKILLKFLSELTDILAGAVFFTALGLLAIFFGWYWFSLFIIAVCLPLLALGIRLIYSKFEKNYKSFDSNQKNEVEN